MVRAKYHRGCHRPQRWVFGVRSREAPWLHSARTSAWHPNAVANHPARHRFRHQCGPTNGVHMPNWRHSAMFTKRWTIAGISRTQLRAYAPTMSRHTGAPSSNGSRGWSAPRPGLCHPTWMSTCGVNATAARRRWRSLTCSVTSQNDIRCSDITVVKLPPTTGPFQDHPHFTEKNTCPCRLHVHVYCLCFIASLTLIARIKAGGIMRMCGSADVRML